MSEQVPPNSPAPTDGTDTIEGGKYEAKYIRVSKIGELLVEGTGDNAIKLRISGDAKDAVKKYFDEAVEAAAKRLIGCLPRKSKGDAKGELKRVTIQLDDIPEN